MALWHRNHREEHHEEGNLRDAPATVRVLGTAIGASGIGSGGPGANASISNGATKHLEATWLDPRWLRSHYNHRNWNLTSCGPGSQGTQGCLLSRQMTDHLVHSYLLRLPV